MSKRAKRLGTNSGVRVACRFVFLSRLEHSFGMGQGRYLDQQVADYLEVPYFVCRSPVGHRKVGYLCGVPQRFVKKFSNFYHSLLLRMKHAGRPDHGRIRSGNRKGELLAKS